ncbi:hypothetical protein TIFTF001_008425 [Ficus carica]|uniref:Glycosyltransferase n=1 Tax=Ficus carica TaxID=3494 RepID=A0AA87ZS58_FICCA|nr:hypothetical protein TIFTF001_008425 [Ficus carica]
MENTHAKPHAIIVKTSTPTEGKDDRDIFTGAPASGLDIRYKTVSDGFPLSFNRLRNLQQFDQGNLHVFPAHMDELVGNLVKEDPSVSCLIADTFYTSTSWIAEKYKLVDVSFWTEPALVFTLNYHRDLLVKNGHFASNDNREDTIDYIPGVKAIEPKDLTTYLQSTDTTALSHRIICKSFDDVKNADFILCNTVQQLECDTILAIQEKQPFYAIGPVFPSEFTKSIVPTSLRADFVASEKSDIEEIAHGLVLSGVNFIWVLRHDAVSYEKPYTLPLRIEHEIKDQRLIVPLCNQVEVILNPAIGGFLTHCGWNSIFKSVWCGVPLLCFPLLGGQPTNRKLVVDDWKVGINLCDRKPLTRLEVAQKINRLMSRKLAKI